MNVPTNSNIPIMLFYFGFFYYGVAFYPIFKVCNILSVQIIYKRVANYSQSFPVGFTLFLPAYF